MKKLITVCAALAALSFCNVVLAADEKPMPPEASKTEKTSPLKTVSCGSPCDFAVSSHDETELMSIVKSHAKKHHNMKVSDAQIKGMMKETSN